MNQTKDRILSIDAFRGITIFVMVFVNEVAGIRDVPVWMKHMPANADAMTFVDLVFPAFLFIVGMSIPFALDRRKQKGDSFWQLQAHIIWRTLGLLVLGVFMVNAEEGVNAAATGMKGSVWSLLFYLCVILIWNVYEFSIKSISWAFRLIGVAGLIVLGLIYRGGEDGAQRMSPHWWGILGLIGWAYLFSCIIYQLFKGDILGLLTMILFCIAFYCVANASSLGGQPALRWMKSQAGNAAHTSIVLCGIVLSRIFFYGKSATTIKNHFVMGIGFALLLFIAGYLLRPYFKISKIYATPTWCLYSAGICSILFTLLYWVIDRRGISKWTAFFKPAATNPLLTYIIPGILAAVFSLFRISIFPNNLRYGLPGILYAFVFAVAVMWLAIGLNKLKIKLQL